MKTPLGYQLTEYDCGPTSLINVLSYLYEREQIPPNLLKKIYEITLDEYETKGTSKNAMQLISQTINNYKTNNFSLNTEYLKGKEVNIDTIKKYLEKNSCILLRTYLKVEHYVIITHIDKHYIYIWDPYYLDERYKNKNIIIEKENYNRVINIKRFTSKRKKDFALGPTKNRECIIFQKPHFVIDSTSK